MAALTPLFYIPYYCCWLFDEVGSATNSARSAGVRWGTAGRETPVRRHAAGDGALEGNSSIADADPRFRGPETTGRNQSSGTGVEPSSLCFALPHRYDYPDDHRYCSQRDCGFDCVRGKLSVRQDRAVSFGGDTR